MNNLREQLRESYSISTLRSDAQVYIEHIIAKRCLGMKLTQEEEIALEQTKARAKLLYSKR